MLIIFWPSVASLSLADLLVYLYENCNSRFHHSLWFHKSIRKPLSSSQVPFQGYMSEFFRNLILSQCGQQ